MLNFLIKSILVISSSTSIALLSTSWSKAQNNDAIHKINLGNKTKTIDKITRLEDIDVWGKENGCNFIFVKDWTKNEIYNAKEFAEANGGRNKAIRGSKKESKYKTLEKAIVGAVNDHKAYCYYKLKTFTFLWSPASGNFYIEDPSKQTEINNKHTKATLKNLWP